VNSRSKRVQTGGKEEKCGTGGGGGLGGHSWKRLERTILKVGKKGPLCGRVEKKGTPRGTPGRERRQPGKCKVRQK